MDAKMWDRNCGAYNFKGFGPSDGGRVWFMGLEFRGELEYQKFDFDRGEVVYPFSSVQVKNESTGKRPTRIYNYMSRIMWGLYGRKATHIEHRDSHLFQDDGSFFTNLYVFPQPSHRSFPPFMRDLGFTSLEDYWATMREYRFPMLQKFWGERPRAYTICFGEDDGFRYLFRLNGKESDESLADGQIQYFKQERVFLSPFFGLRGLGKGALKLSAVDEISETMIRDWPTSCGLIEYGLPPLKSAVSSR